MCFPKTDAGKEASRFRLSETQQGKITFRRDLASAKSKGKNKTGFSWKGQAKKGEMLPPSWSWSRAKGLALLSGATLAPSVCISEDRGEHSESNISWFPVLLERSP